MENRRLLNPPLATQSPSPLSVPLPPPLPPLSAPSPIQTPGPSASPKKDSINSSAYTFTPPSGVTSASQWLALGQSEFQAGKYGSSVKYFETAAGEERTCETLLWLCKALLAHYSSCSSYTSKDEDNVRLLLEECVTLDPTNLEGWTLLGTLLHKLKNERCVDCFEKALSLSHQPTTLLMMGKALCDMKRLEKGLEAFDRALAISPNDLDVLTEKSLALYRSGQNDEALVHLDRILSIDPNNNLAMMNKGLCLLALGFPDQALQVFDELILRSPHNPSPWRRKGYVLLDLGRPLEAFDALQKATSLDPKHSYAWYQMGTALFRLSRFDYALDCIERAVALDPQQLDAIFLKGFLLRQKNPEGALKAFDRVLASCPSDHRVLYHKGETLYKLQHYQDALEALDEALSLHQSDEDYWVYKGLSLTYLKNHKKAMEVWDSALRICPQWTKVRLNKGRLCFTLGRMQEALGCYEAILAYHPNNPSAWRNKGYVLKALEKNQEAVECLDRAITVEPRHAKSWLVKGQVLHRLLMMDEARKAVDVALEVGSEAGVIGECWFLKGCLFDEQRSFESALACYEKALVYVPKHLLCLWKRVYLLKHFGRWREALEGLEKIKTADGRQRVDSVKAQLLFQLGRDEETLWVCERALVALPKDAVLWTLKGRALGRMGRYEEAMNCFDEMLEWNSVDPAPWIRKAEIYMEMKKFEEAMEAVDGILRRDPLNCEAYSMRVLLIKKRMMND